MNKISKDLNLSRRDVFKQGVAVAAGVVAASSLFRTTPAQAEVAKIAQAGAMYQATPHGQQACDKCIHFIPGKSASANGSCKLVQGSISPKGWCVLFTTKS